MPVDKFGRMSDLKTKDTGVSLTYINNNYVRSDGETPLTGSLDMRGNTLYNVADPVNPQDVATKEYADNVGGVDTAIYKTRYGTYGSKGNIDMRGYTLMNVLDPADAQDVATKKYVDSANRAFIFNNNKYLAVGEVSMGGKRLENVGTPLENLQATNKFYVDTLVETAIVGDKALKKLQDGLFASTGNIDMEGQFTVLNVKTPIDDNHITNKKYVDEMDNLKSAFAFRNGAYYAKGGIIMRKNKLGGLQEPTNDGEAATKNT